jgi:hypothetical protein
MQTRHEKEEEAQLFWQIMQEPLYILRMRRLGAMYAFVVNETLKSRIYKELTQHGSTISNAV